MFPHLRSLHISLQSCFWGAHYCLRQRETDNALARAQQVGELIKCVSTADLQLPARREGWVQAPGPRAGDIRTESAWRHGGWPWEGWDWVLAVDP